MKQILKGKKKVVYVLIAVLIVVLFILFLAYSQKRSDRSINVKKPQPKEMTLEEAATLYNAPSDSKDKVEVSKEVLDTYSSSSPKDINSNESIPDAETNKVEVPKEILDSFSAPKK